MQTRGRARHDAFDAHRARGSEAGRASRCLSGREALCAEQTSRGRAVGRLCDIEVSLAPTIQDLNFQRISAIVQGSVIETTKSETPWLGQRGPPDRGYI